MGRKKNCTQKAYIGGLMLARMSLGKTHRAGWKYIKLYSKPGSVVLRSVCGTGTTLIAGRAGRNRACSELRPRWPMLSYAAPEAGWLTVELVPSSWYGSTNPHARSNPRPP